MNSGSGDLFFGDKIIGDKILGNKIVVEQVYAFVQEAVSLDTVRDNLLEAIKDLIHNQVDRATHTLDVIKKLGGLDKSAKQSIHAIRVLFGLPVTDQEQNGLITAYQAQIDENENSDLVNASALVLLGRLKNSEVAIHHYELKPKGPFTQYVYYRDFADADTLIGLVNELKGLPMMVLDAIFNRSLELGCLAVSRNVLAVNQVTFPFEDFTKQEVLCECVNLNEFIQSEYYQLTHSHKRTLDGIIDKLTSYCRSAVNLEPRFLILVAQIIDYTHYTDQRLLDTARAHQPQLKQKEYFGYTTLKDMLGDSEKDDLSQVPFASHSTERLGQILVETATNGKINTPCIHQLCIKGNSKDIVKILDSLYVSVETNGELSILGNYCMLAAKASNILIGSDFPTSRLKSIFSKKFSDIQLSIPFVDSLCMLFAQNGYESLAVLVYQQAFKETIPWVSEPYLAYLRLLFHIKQFDTLSRLMVKIPDSEKQLEGIVVLESCFASTSSQHEKATALAKANLTRFQNRILTSDEKNACLYHWSQLLKITSQYSEEETNKLVMEIPLDIFIDPKNELAWELLSFFKCRFLDVAQLLLDWFFTDPDRYAAPYFNVVLAYFQSESTENLPDSIGPYLAAYSFTQNKEMKTRIVVEDEERDSCPRFFFAESGQHARKLAETKIDDWFILNAKTCSLKSVHSPIIAAYHIASGIRDDDETECFHIAQFPENATPEEMWEVIENLTEGDREHYEKLKPIMAAATPVHFKYGLVRGHGSIEKAITAILDSDVRIDVLNSQDDGIGEPLVDDIVLDEIGALFLSFSGLSFQPNVELHMAKETYTQLCEWVKASEGHYVNLDQEKGYLFFTKDKEQSPFPEMIDNLSQLLDRVKAHEETMFDVPLSLSIYGKALTTDSTLYGIGLAQKYQWGYFCPDQLMRYLLRSEEFTDSTLGIGSFRNFLFTKRPLSAVCNLMRLSGLSVVTYFPWDTLWQMLLEGTDQELDQFLLLIKGASVDTDSMNNFAHAQKVILMRQLLSYVKGEQWQGYEKISIGILNTALRGKLTEQQKGEFVYELLPINFLEEYLDPSKSFYELEMNAEIILKLTDDFVNSVNAASKGTPNHSKKVWCEVASLCS